jgi:uncharacterized protein YdeI (YjbR/CyaY-like superfamily)
MNPSQNPKIDAYLRKVTKWRAEMEALRGILLGFPLDEELKWGKPCYTFQGSNLLIIQGFKEACALLFCKGALLRDPEGILQKPGENTQAARRIMFRGVQEIAEMEALLKTLIAEALEAEKAGLEVTYKKTAEFDIPDEFQHQLDARPALKTAFEALTPGRQRAYILHFSAAKQPQTRAARVEKCVPRILDGLGLND